MSNSFTMLSKSSWQPAIRREHALAREALRHEYSVEFIERPSDVRSINDSFREWAKGLRGVSQQYDGASITQRSTLVPGHRSDAARVLDVSLLQVMMKEFIVGRNVVSYLPWQWTASRRASHRVFDCTDPWPKLYPHRESEIRKQMARISDEANEVIVVAEELAEYFPNRHVHVIPNGVDSDLLDTPYVDLPGTCRMLYLGTLSERIDFHLLAKVLTDLPEWSLDLVGPCAFRGSGDGPSDQLKDFLRRFETRVTLHGPVARKAAQPYIDNCDVLVAPTFPEFSVGQSSMKAFDAAARGRKVLATPGISTGVDSSPALLFADSADEWIHHLRNRVFALDDPRQIRGWAENQTWDIRFKKWISLVVAK